MLAHNRLLCLLDYNKETGLFIWKENRGRKAKSGDKAGSKDTHGYVQICIDGTMYLAHRLAWFYVNKEWPSLRMDHINNVRDDNRILNLRLATSGQNSCNSSLRKDNVYGLKGIRWRPSGRWQARIRANKVLITIGTYDSPEEAHEAYCDAANKYHGEFARTS